MLREGNQLLNDKGASKRESALKKKGALRRESSPRWQRHIEEELLNVKEASALRRELFSRGATVKSTPQRKGMVSLEGEDVIVASRNGISFLEGEYGMSTSRKGFISL